MGNPEIILWCVYIIKDLIVCIDHKVFQSNLFLIILFLQADPGWVKTDITSGEGNKTVDEGAETPVFVALLPPGTKIQGKHFADCKVDDFWQMASV